MTEGELNSICSQLKGVFERYAEYQKDEIKAKLIISECSDEEIRAAKVKTKYLDELIASINNTAQE